MKSIIICDMEGIIQTMNKDAEAIFGYKAEELVGKKRVSIFSPGEIVLQNVATWLKEAREKGAYHTETVFKHKNGSKINAKIKITPTFANGKSQEQTGYCGITELVDHEVNPKISFSTHLIKALAITRMPFLSAVIMPALIGAAFAATFVIPGLEIAFSWTNFWLTLLGVVLLHLGSNVMNDYFDVKDGTDDANTDYFLQYSGGSRAIELGLISLKQTKTLGLALLGGALIVGIYLTIQTGITTLFLGLAGLAIGYFYTAPPLRLVARKGLGELGIALAFGPLVTAGMVYVLTGEISFLTFLLGLPVGLLTANILLINEFPDAKSDATTGKNHLVVTYGKKKSVGIYLAILVASFIANLAIVFLLPTLNIWLLGVAVASFVFGLIIFQHIKRNYESRELVKSNVNTIALSALTGLLMAIAMLF